MKTYSVAIGIKGNDELVFESDDYQSALDYFNQISRIETKVNLLENFWSYTKNRQRIRVILKIRM